MRAAAGEPCRTCRSIPRCAWSRADSPPRCPPLPPGGTPSGARSGTAGACPLATSSPPGRRAPRWRLRRPRRGVWSRWREAAARAPPRAAQILRQGGSCSARAVGAPVSFRPPTSRPLTKPRPGLPGAIHCRQASCFTSAEFLASAASHKPALSSPTRTPVSVAGCTRPRASRAPACPRRCPCKSAPSRACPLPAFWTAQTRVPSTLLVPTLARCSAMLQTTASHPSHAWTGGGQPGVTGCTHATPGAIEPASTLHASRLRGAGQHAPAAGAPRSSACKEGAQRRGSPQACAGRPHSTAPR